MSEVKRYSFSGEMYRDHDKLVYVDFPFDAATEFGTPGKIKIKAWIEGQFVRKSLVPKGNGVHRLAVTMDIRIAIGKDDGDTVSVELEADTDPRIVALPEELEWLLDNEPDIKALFLKQAYSTQLYFTKWIMEAKDPDTCVARINHLFFRLRHH
jgi:hypothetical protein